MVNFEGIKTSLAQLAYNLKRAFVFGASAAAAFWLLGNLEPLKHVAAVAGVTSALHFGFSLATYKFTELVLSRAIRQEAGAIRKTFETALIKTAAISLATFVLTGGLSLPAFVATALLTEAFSNLENSTFLSNIENKSPR